MRFFANTVEYLRVRACHNLICGINGLSFKTRLFYLRIIKRRAYWQTQGKNCTLNERDKANLTYKKSTALVKSNSFGDSSIVGDSSLAG